ncbi:MAG: FkbM family methyltransferase [Blastocatellales bacterium]
MRRYVKFLSDSSYRAERSERQRLKTLPRYLETRTTFKGNQLKIVDALTYLEGVDEIFRKEVYKFNSLRQDPVILDCGANIGLSTLYFKQLYPESSIFSFEPDPQIFGCLRFNTESFGYLDVQAINKAVWTDESVIQFQIEGGYSGRIAKKGDDSNLSSVATVRLRDYLNNKIDFVKLDIEGAEGEVISDCADKLHNVYMLFIEYHSHINEEQRLDKILNILSGAGFRYHIKEAFTSQNPFIDRPLMVGMDLQLNVYAYQT